MALVSDVTTRVNYLFKEAGIDENDRRWRDAEFFLWVNDGQSEIMRMNPEATSTRREFTCAAGAVQELDATDYLLLRAHGMTLFVRDLLDLYDPGWEDAAAGTPAEYAYDSQRDTRRFYVNPPAAANAKINLTVSQRCTAVTALGDSLTVKDEYLPALALYVAHRGMSKQAEYGSAGLDASFLAQFRVAMGG